MMMRKLLAAMRRRKLLTAFTVIALFTWFRGNFVTIWYTTRKPTASFAIVFDAGGILVQHIRLADELFNAPGTEVHYAFLCPPINDIAIQKDESYIISRMGLIEVPSEAPWKFIPTGASRYEFAMLYGDGRNFYLPYWLIFLALLLLWLRPHRKGIVTSVRQKWRPKLEPPPLPPPAIDQGPQLNEY